MPDSRAAQVRFSDYRDVPRATSTQFRRSVLTEHIGEANYPAYFSFLRSKTKPWGRMLNHSITASMTSRRFFTANSFVNRYVFPMANTGPAKVMMAATNENGSSANGENIRVHYAKTLHCWRMNLEDNWDAAVAGVGERKARVWALVTAASEFGFAHNIIQLHQFLLTNTTEDGYPECH